MVSVFAAESLFGRDHLSKISESIAGARCWAIVLTPATIASAGANRELEQAMASVVAARDIDVLPILRSPCKLPGCLRGKRCADFTDDRGYEAAFGRLLACLREAGSVHARARADDPAGSYPTNITIDPLPGFSPRLISLFCRYYENFYRCRRIPVDEEGVMRLAAAGLIVFREYYDHGQWGYEFAPAGCRLVDGIYGHRISPCPRGYVCDPGETMRCEEG